MRTGLKLLVLMLLSTFAFALATAQSLPQGKQVEANQSRWIGSLSRADVRAGETVDFVARIQIDGTFHIFSVTQPEGGPFVTQFVLPEGSKYKLVGQPKQKEFVTKHDEGFEMDVQYFEKETEFVIPIQIPADAKGEQTLTVQAQYQLCNETGCLNPQYIDIPVTVALQEGSARPEFVSAASSSNNGGTLVEANSSRWKGSLSRTDIRAGEVVDFVAHVQIDGTYHIFSLTQPEGGPFVTQIVLPEGSPFEIAGRPQQKAFLTKHDEGFEMDVQYFEKETDFVIPIRVPKDASGQQTLLVSVTYQLCNETGCLNPQTVEIPVTFTVADGDARSEFTGGAAAGSSDSGDGVKKQSILGFLIAAAVAGVISIFTPCVFPMIPITVSFFSKQKTNEDPRHGVKMATAYCLGIVGTFTALGLLMTMIFGATGISRLATNMWVNLALAILFVVLAFSLFGFFEIQVPSGLANKFRSTGTKKGGYVGPILMGLAFSLTSFTCTVPFVGTVLAGAVSTGNYLMPTIGMLVFSGVFALPFFFLALFPGYLARLPKSGSWLESIKAYMGFLELAMAVKFFSNVELSFGRGYLTYNVALALWGMIFAIAGIYMLGTLRFPHNDSSAKIGPARKAVGLGTVLFASYLFFTMSGKFNLSPAIMSLLPPQEYPYMPGYGPKVAEGEGKSEHADGLHWYKDYKEAVEVAKRENKPIFIDFTGVFCTNCRLMEKQMFPKAEVKAELEKFVRVQLYTDRPTPADKFNFDLCQKLSESIALPVYVTLNPDETKIADFQGLTYSVETYVNFLKKRTSELASN